MLDNYYVQGTGNNYRNKAQGDRFVKKEYGTGRSNKF